MRNFQLKGWLAVGVALAAAVALVLSVTLINRVSASVEAFGVTHYGAVHVDDGSVSEPSHGFTDDTDTGFYRVGSNDIGVAAGGSKVGDFTSAGWSGGVSVGSNDLAGRNITATGTANDLHAAFLAKTVETWTVAHPDTSTWACSGFVTNFGIKTDVEGKVTNSVTIKCSGLPVFTDHA